MRILITNDDGITAPGLEVAEAIAAEIAGADGEIWVVAPAFEQSGVSHCVSYIRPMRIEHLDERRYAVEGSPADCVLAGLNEILAKSPPDLVLSGVNRGHNVAEDTLYSGTVGGAMEGALHGIPSVALSQYHAPGAAASADSFAPARAHGAGVIRKVLAASPGVDGDYRLFFNLNFPRVPAAQVRGVRVSPQAFRRGTSFAVEPHSSPSGRRFLWIKGGNQQIRTAPGSDAAVNLDGYVSVTPMRADLTAHDALEAIKTIE